MFVGCLTSFLSMNAKRWKTTERICRRLVERHVVSGGVGFGKYCYLRCSPAPVWGHFRHVWAKKRLLMVMLLHIVDTVLHIAWCCFFFSNSLFLLSLSLVVLWVSCVVSVTVAFVIVCIKSILLFGDTFIDFQSKFRLQHTKWMDNGVGGGSAHRLRDRVGISATKKCCIYNGVEIWGKNQRCNSRLIRIEMCVVHSGRVIPKRNDWMLGSWIEWHLRK